jgi:hypothetical protein
MASGGEGGKVRTLELELGSRPRRLKKYLGRPQRSRFGRRLSRSTLDTGTWEGCEKICKVILWDMRLCGQAQKATLQDIQYSSTVVQ